MFRYGLEKPALPKSLNCGSGPEVAGLKFCLGPRLLLVAPVWHVGQLSLGVVVPQKSCTCCLEAESLRDILWICSRMSSAMTAL